MRRLKKILPWLCGLAVLLVAVVWLVYRLPAFGGAFDGPPPERWRASPQFHGDRFENTPPYVSQLKMLDEARAYFGPEQRAPGLQVPVQPLAADSLTRPAAPGLRAWWLGWASVLLEIDGVRILTDPVFSERVSPFSFVGPARMHAPPLALAQWTGIDAAVISHDHFDHLDMDTVRHLAAGGTQFFVGLGIGEHLKRWQVPAAQIHELDWWEKAELKGVTIHCTPARHYAGRRRMDNSTLWASWLIRGPKHSAYHSGDTGYADHFRQIRERLGAPQLALIKIGAYGQSWLDIHMDPESAVRAHRDLGAAAMLPIHWATFNLAYHAWAEPIERTVAAAQAQGVQLLTPRPGEKVEFGVPFESRPWYRP